MSATVLCLDCGSELQRYGREPHAAWRSVDGPGCIARAPIAGFLQSHRPDFTDAL